MLSYLSNYVFYTDNLLGSHNEQSIDLKKFLNNLCQVKYRFFTHNCDVSRESLYNKLKSQDIACDFNNVMTPTYLLINYCKSLYGKFSAYPISHSKDYADFYLQNITITYDNPDLFFICTKDIDNKYIEIINNSSIPIVLSSNLCVNRACSCDTCAENCSIKYLKTFNKNRIIIPDLPPVYNSYYLFKDLNIEPKNTAVITNILRDDYIQFQRSGCKIILLLKNKSTFDDYLKSPYDADLVIDSFKNLSYFLNIKEEA